MELHSFNGELFSFFIPHLILPLIIFLLGHLHIILALWLGSEISAEWREIIKMAEWPVAGFSVEWFMFAYLAVHWAINLLILLLSSSLMFAFYHLVWKPDECLVIEVNNEFKRKFFFLMQKLSSWFIILDWLFGLEFSTWASMNYNRYVITDFKSLWRIFKTLGWFLRPSTWFLQVVLLLTVYSKLRLQRRMKPRGLRVFIDRCKNTFFYCIHVISFWLLFTLGNITQRCSCQRQRLVSGSYVFRLDSQTSIFIKDNKVGLFPLIIDSVLFLNLVSGYYNYFKLIKSFFTPNKPKRCPIHLKFFTKVYSPLFYSEWGKTGLIIITPLKIFARYEGAFFQSYAGITEISFKVFAGFKDGWSLNFGSSKKTKTSFLILFFRWSQIPYIKGKALENESSSRRSNSLGVFFARAENNTFADNHGNAPSSSELTLLKGRLVRAALPAEDDAYSILLALKATVIIIVDLVDLLNQERNKKVMHIIQKGPLVLSAGSLLAKGLIPPMGQLNYSHDYSFLRLRNLNSGTGCPVYSSDIFDYSSGSSDFCPHEQNRTNDKHKRESLCFSDAPWCSLQELSASLFLKLSSVSSVTQVVSLLSLLHLRRMPSSHLRLQEL